MKHLIGALICIVIFSACTAKKKDVKNELNMAVSSKMTSIDPALCYDTVCARVLYQVYDTLFEYEYLKRPYTLRANIAAKMPELSADKLTYTITLKDNIYYHTNNLVFKDKKRKVKAQDFVNALKRMAHIPTRSTGWWLFDGKVKGLNKFRDEVKDENVDNFLNYNVEGLKVLSDLKFSITLTRPNPQVLYALAMVFTSPVPEEAIRHYNNDLSKWMIGTGPFYLDKWEKANRIIIKKNPEYKHSFYPTVGDKELLSDAGKQLPFVDQVTFYVMKESQTRWLSFLSNKIDLVGLDKDNYALAIAPDGGLTDQFKKKNINLQLANTLTYWWLAFNMTDKVVGGDNLNLRKAIAHAINFDKYIKDFTHNVAQRANSIYPPGVAGYSKDTKLPFEYNVEKAKKYLELAGFPGGKGLPEINYDIRSTSTNARQEAEFIQKELAAVGIKIKINVNNFQGFLRKARTGQIQFWSDGWAMDYPAAENSAQLLYGKNKPPGPNSSSYANPIVDKLYEELAETGDETKVLELTKKIEDTVNKDLPWIMNFYSRYYVLYHSHIQNYKYTDLINNSLKYYRVQSK